MGVDSAFVIRRRRTCSIYGSIYVPLYAPLCSRRVCHFVKTRSRYGSIYVPLYAPMILSFCKNPFTLRFDLGTTLRPSNFTPRFVIL